MIVAAADGAVSNVASARPEDEAQVMERWKQEAAYYHLELARCTQLWQEREQELLSQIDMRDAELNDLENRVRTATMNCQACESARDEATAKASQLSVRAQELEKQLADSLWSKETPAQRTPRAGENPDEVGRLQARAERAEEHVMRLSEMLESVCRQEAQLVALLASAREQLWHLAGGQGEPPPREFPEKKMVPLDSNKSPASTAGTVGRKRQPISATTNFSCDPAVHALAASMDANRVLLQASELNIQAREQEQRRLQDEEKLQHAADEAAAIQREIKRLRNAVPKPPGAQRSGRNGRAN
mmetsp:Transcript_146462/g.255440  ORF Transcript_146462/g.255440 Transcript_146462/m.255440 type:complete len:302 (+) Transcript_146462:80-985(+)